MPIDDETLMALADGELDPEEAAHLSAAIADDPRTQARLRRFSETRARLSAMRADGPAAPADDALIARIRAASVAPLAPAGSAAAPVPANRDRAPLAAIAAALTAAVVGLGWWQMGGPATDLPAAQVSALDTLPSGQAAILGDGADLTMIASYRIADGTLCREYETVRDAAVSIGVACRANGAWQRRFASDTSLADGYVPASGDIAALDDWLAQTGAGDPLTPEDEAAALAE